MSPKTAPGTETERPPASGGWRIASSWITLLFGTWGVFVLARYWQSTPVEGRYFFSVLQQFLSGTFLHAYAVKVAGSVFLAAVMLVLAWRMGQWILVALGIRELTPGEAAAFSTALGLGGWSGATAALGLFGFWTKTSFILLLVILAFLLVWKKPPLSCSRPPAAPSGPWSAVWMGLLAFFFLIFLLGDFTPEIFFDSLFYHLGVPNLYRLEHRIYNVPLLYANFITTLQMVYGFAITVGTEITAKCLHGATAVLLAVLFHAFARRFLRPGSEWIAPLIFFSMPMVGRSISTCGIDVGWTLFQFAGVYALILGLQETNEKNPKASLPWLRLSGIFTGLAATCKYPALTAVPLTLLVLVWQRRWVEKCEWSSLRRELVHWGMPAIALTLPLFLRNLWFHGNPVYPFVGTVWGTPRIEALRWMFFQGDAPSRMFWLEFHRWDTAVRFLFHPWFLAFEGRTASNFMGPVFLLFLPLFFLKRLTTLPLQIIQRFALLFWIQWWATTTTARYAFPALAFFSIWLAASLLDLKEGRRLALGLLAIALVNNLYWTWHTLERLQGWKVLNGQMTESDYLRDARPSYPAPPYEAMEWMNGHLPAEAKVLFAGEARSYRMERKTIPSSPYDPQPLWVYAAASQNGADMARRLRQDGVTHLFLNMVHAIQNESYQLYPFDSATWPVFQEFWNHSVRVVWQGEQARAEDPKGLYVYELLSDQEAARPHPVPLNLWSRWAPPVQKRSSPAVP